MIHAEVTRHGNENIAGMMRRFSRKMQSAGLVKRMRSIRYHKRAPSNARTKHDALVRIERTSKYRELVKEGRDPSALKRRR